MQQAGLANVNLFVDDVQKAYQFYSSVFGFADEPSMSHPPEFLVLNAGSCTFSFQPRQAVGMESEPVGGLELGFEVANVSATVQALQYAGGRIERQNHMEWGDSVDGYDLDGHRITIYRRG